MRTPGRSKRGQKLFCMGGKGNYLDNGKLKVIKSHGSACCGCGVNDRITLTTGRNTDPALSSDKAGSPSQKH